jgi:hypothetical protein
MILAMPRMTAGEASRGPLWPSERTPRRHPFGARQPLPRRRQDDVFIGGQRWKDALVGGVLGWKAPSPRSTGGPAPFPDLAGTPATSRPRRRGGRLRTRHGRRHQRRDARWGANARRARVRRCGRLPRATLKLPLPDRPFDAVTIAFGIRNVPRIDAALAEAYRVLRIGGRFLCLEFSNVDVPGLNVAYDFYSFNVIPAIGRAVTGDADAYRYLVESIRKFPKPAAFAEMMRKAGFRRVSHQPLTGGIVAIHSGWRL